jgi:hypothetical protein
MNTFKPTSEVREEELNHLRRSSPNDLRALGWTVAVHNDYRQDGQDYTFWLVTQGNLCFKGEGRTDSAALESIREQIRKQAWVNPSWKP